MPANRKNAMYVTESENLLQVFAGNPPKTLPKIIPGVYTLMFNDTVGFYLEKHTGFSLPPKLYGDTVKQCNRIVTTFKDRNENTGVLLSGEKGSGKTLLAKAVGIECVNFGMPVIVVSSGYQGDNFKSFLARIDQPYMLMFDEFEKVYNKTEGQDFLLSILDGVMSQKRLTVMTTNDVFKINQYMMNRPGRIFYNLSFDGLSDKFIEEYVEDHLENKSNAPGLIKLSEVFPKLNFDMLKSIIEEMNRYNEAAIDTLEYLNIKHTDHHTHYSIDSITKDGNSVECDEQSINMGHPLISGADWIYINDEDGSSLFLSPKDIVNSTKDTYTYLVNGYKVVLKKESPPTLLDKTRNFLSS